MGIKNKLRSFKSSERINEKGDGNHLTEKNVDGKFLNILKSAYSKLKSLVC